LAYNNDKLGEKELKIASLWNTTVGATRNLGSGVVILPYFSTPLGLLKNQTSVGYRLYLNYTSEKEHCQEGLALAPRDRYQVMEEILTKGGASPLKRLWEKIKKEEPHLWQTWLTGKYTI